MGDETSEYPHEYWDSDEYDDDDDVGYTRQPIEDETWFLAHEIDYPSDTEKGPEQRSIPDQEARIQTKEDDDDQSFAEEDSYFSGEQFFQSKNVDRGASSEDPVVHYDGQLMDNEELNLMRKEPVWKGFVTQSSDLILDEHENPNPGVYCVEDDHHSSVRSIGVGISSDVADMGSEVRESLLEGSSEGDIEFFHGRETYINKAQREKQRARIKDSDKYVVAPVIDGGFSFTPPIRADEALRVESETDSEYCNGFMANQDDMLTTWQKESGYSHRGGSRTSSASSASRNKFKDDAERETSDAREEDPAAVLDDEEAAAVQEQIRQIRTQEEEFETFNLKIVHRKNRYLLSLSNGESIIGLTFYFTDNQNRV